MTIEATRGIDGYVPKNPEKYQAMVKLMSSAETVEDLKNMVLLYTFDMSYDRQDILMVLKMIERERGWRV